MPKRDTTIRCVCTSCKDSGDLAADGSPLGKLIPATQRIAHQRRMQLEESTLDSQETIIQDAVYSVIRDTLKPCGPNSDDQPSRLWVSRHDFQHEKALQQHPEGSEDPPIDAILEGIQRLQISSNKPSSTPSTPSRHASKSEKSELNHRTQTAHKALDDIQARVASCIGKLSTAPSQSVVAEVAAEVVQIQVSFDNVKRDVQSVNIRKHQLAESIIRLRKDFAKHQPENDNADHPLEYTSSMS